MSNTLNGIIEETTLKYLDDIEDIEKTPKEIEEELLGSMQMELGMYAQKNGLKKSSVKIPQKLDFYIIAEILARRYPICTINTAGTNADESYDLLAIYMSEGKNEGIYVTDENTFSKLIKEFNYSITSRESDECINRLRLIVERKERTCDKDLIALNNGIFNYSEKKLLPFSPDYVFLTKSRVNYNENAKCINIHNDLDDTDWNVEDWMNDLSDDPGVVHLLWQILGAIIRPHVSWNKSRWFYSEKGNNGKGTLCELMRQICGDGAYASIPLSDMGKDFMLEPLTRASAIIVDENDVGTFIDKAANLKAIVTNDVIQINRKFKTPIPYKFYGFMVQCLNEMPRVRDKSDSFFRRQIFIPFNKCFTGKERRYIKTDYLRRPEVLEYVLYKVLHMEYYTFDVPPSCEQALNDYKEFNDPVRVFIDEVVNECSWDLIPFTFLYDLYKKWFKLNMPSGTIQNKSTFINDLIGALGDNEIWYATRKTQYRTNKFTFKCEPLIAKYELTEWENSKYKNKKTATMEDRCTINPDSMTDRQRGIVRRSVYEN